MGFSGFAGGGHVPHRAKGRNTLYFRRWKKKDKVNLRLFKDRQAAAQSHLQGVAQLYCLYFAKDLKFLKKNLTMPADMEKAANYFGGRKQVEARLFNRVVEDLFSRPIRTEKQFHDHARSCVNRILAVGNTVMEYVLPVIRHMEPPRSDLHA